MKMIHLLFVVLTAATLLPQMVECLGVTEWLKSGSAIEFNSKEVPHTGLLNRLHWIEKTERSTSRNYTLWEDADVYILEWPGNITLFNPDNPLVKWGNRRAKYLEDPCGLEFTGIEMRVYAYNYVYLTWGSNRLTRTYTTPLTVPRSIIPGQTLAKLSQRHSYEENALNTIVVHDIAFTFDTLLLAYANGVIRVSGLEMAWAELSKVPKRKLKYSVSTSITGPLDKIIVQSCCLKTDFCSFGHTVVAYLEHSAPSIIYVSRNSGQSFRQVQPRLPVLGSLKLVLSYPEQSLLLVFLGNDKMVTMNQISLSSNGYSNYESSQPSSMSFPVKGNLYGSRLGMDSSFVIWDNCNVWYSADTESNITRSLLYIHKRIKKGNEKKLHVITSEYCSFGRNSALAHGSNGKFVLLGGNNLLFLGIDAKGNLSQLVALKTDMSLLIRGKELSVTPFIEHGSDQPKLMYPPRYLELPKTIKLGRSYERRLGMRILPKNVYPSDYILSFYEENVKDLEVKKNLALRPCQTSSLKVNRSITQKRKLYHVSSGTSLNFTIEFSSRTKKIRQLNFEPPHVLKYLNVKVIPESIETVTLQNPQYLMKYRAVITAKPLTQMRKLLWLNFYTKQDLRCNYQPRVTIFIKLESKPSTTPHILSDEDMTRSVYLKSVTSGHTTYLDKGLGEEEPLKPKTCPYKK